MDLLAFVSNIKNYGTVTVEVEFKSLRTNNIINCDLLFDTGASHTAICENILIKGGYSKFTQGKTARQTANGKVTLQRCKLNNFRLSGFQGIPIFEVDVIKYNFEGFQVILGMDFISKLETWISVSRQKFHIFGNYKNLANEVLDLTKTPQIDTMSKSNIFNK